MSCFCTNLKVFQLPISSMSLLLLYWLISVSLVISGNDEYNLIDTNPICYDLGLCEYGYPGGNYSIHPNSEERTQHLFHNMARSFPSKFITSKYGRNEFGTWGEPTTIESSCLLLSNYITHTTWYDKKLNQMSRWKLWDKYQCEQDATLCGANCDLFSDNECNFIDRCLAFTNDSISCRSSPIMEGIWAANLGYSNAGDCSPIFNPTVLFQGVGFWPKLNTAVSNYGIVQSSSSENIQFPYPIPMG